MRGSEVFAVTLPRAGLAASRACRWPLSPSSRFRITGTEQKLEIVQRPVEGVYPLPVFRSFKQQGNEHLSIDVLEDQHPLRVTELDKCRTLVNYVHGLTVQQLEELLLVHGIRMLAILQQRTNLAVTARPEVQVLGKRVESEREACGIDLYEDFGRKDRSRLKNRLTS